MHTTFLNTLKDISQQTSQSGQQILSTTIASIIDITQPLYRQKHNNYITLIKLIDQTVNQSAQQTPYLTKYLTLYLIAEKREQLLFSDVRIGDILLLRKFLFYQWNQIELQAKYYGTIEEIYVVKCKQLGIDNVNNNEGIILQRKLLNKTNNNNTTNNQQSSFMPIQHQLISQRTLQLKQFIHKNFQKVFNPFYGVKIINNYCSLIEPFSMVLKSFKFELNQFQQLMFLKDTNQNVFYISVKAFRHVGLKEEEWVFIRGVKNITVDRQIVLTPSGNIIKLPTMFYESYQSQANYQAIYRKTSKITNCKQQTTTALTYISLFQQKPSTVKQLFDLQDTYKATSKKQDIILQNNYLIKGVVIKYTGRIKLYHTDYQMIVHDQYLSQVPMQQKRQIIEDKKLVYIFEGTLHLIDKSINTKKQTLKIKLFTNDMKSTFFDQIELEKLNSYIGHSDCLERVNQVLGRIYGKLEKLKQLSTFQNLASLVLEPIRSDELIYRLINTKIA